MFTLISISLTLLPTSLIIFFIIEEVLTDSSKVITPLTTSLIISALNPILLVIDGIIPTLSVVSLIILVVLEDSLTLSAIVKILSETSLIILESMFNSLGSNLTFLNDPKCLTLPPLIAVVILECCCVSVREPLSKL